MNWRLANSGLKTFASRYALMATVIVAIIYGSLYPFEFHNAGSLIADVRHFAGTWNTPPISRGDILANLLLYVPLGLTVVLAFGRQGSSSLVPAMIATGIGASMSLAIELAQYYDSSRVSTFSDFYLNIISTLAGVASAQVARSAFAQISFPADRSSAFARVLLLAWVGWRLYPYVPTIDLHKFLQSIRAAFVVDAPIYAVFRYTVIWLSVAFLFQHGLRPKRPTSLILVLVVCYFFAKVLVVDQFLSLPEILGAAIAVTISRSFLGRYQSVGIPILAALVVFVLTTSRILPWQFAVAPKSFQWIPFFGFFHGSLEVNIISFAEKFYMYGAALLLLLTAGMPLRIAIALEFVLLLCTSVLQMFMVGRSAEISDALLVLILGGIYNSLQNRVPAVSARPPSESL
jgi:VanZ family protein